MGFTAILFEETVKWGFTITLPILLFGYLLKKTWRRFIGQWLLASYCLVFGHCVFSLAYSISNYIVKFRLVSKQNQTESIH